MDIDIIIKSLQDEFNTQDHGILDDVTTLKLVHFIEQVTRILPKPKSPDSNESCDPEQDNENIDHDYYNYYVAVDTTTYASE